MKPYIQFLPSPPRRDYKRAIFTVALLALSAAVSAAAVVVVCIILL